MSMPSGRQTGDVIHYPADTGAWFASQKPMVGTIHGMATLHVDGVRSREADRLWRYRVGRMAHAATTLVTVSQSSARDIASVFPHAAAKLVAIPHGIDLGKFMPTATGQTPEILTSRGFSGPYFAYVGNIEPRKNIPELLRAASAVYRRTGVPLVVSGAPAWGYTDIMDQLGRAAGVHYLGRTSDEDMVALLQQALAFCFPSKYEGFGFPVLEAMACGTPVICSSRGSLSEVASDAAWLLPDIDAASIESAMLEVLHDSSIQDDLRSRGILNARRYDWNVSAKQHADVFRQASESSGRWI
nr:glycosyltransferase family 1 protein [Xylanimonas cellulosilytica]